MLYFDKHLQQFTISVGYSFIDNIGISCAMQVDTALN